MVSEIASRQIELWGYAWLSSTERSALFSHWA